MMADVAKTVVFILRENADDFLHKYGQNHNLSTLLHTVATFLR